MNRSITIKRSTGKCKPITITHEVQQTLREYKRRLLEMKASPDDEVREIDKKTINYIFKKLEPYDQNILLSFYAFPHLKKSDVANMLGISLSVFDTRVKSIIRTIKQNIE